MRSALLIAQFRDRFAERHCLWPWAPVVLCVSQWVTLRLGVSEWAGTRQGVGCPGAWGRPVTLGVC